MDRNETKNPWKAYRESTTNKITFDLGEIGLPDFTVSITNPSAYTPVELNAWLRRTNRETRDRIQAIIDKYESIKKELLVQVETGAISQDEMNDQLTDLDFQEPTIMLATERELIEQWNLTDPETGALLPTPKEDYQVLWRIPIGVQKYLHERLSRIITGEESVPKAKEIK